MSVGTARSRWGIAAAVVAIVAVAVAVVIAWTRSDEGSPSVGGITGEQSRAPLTGLAVDDEAALDHPALAVKVSDVPTAHPQVGVDRADIVFVEPIGESYTRLAAVFHSDLPGTVGPVRSVRPMDAALLGPMSPVFANTMGAEWIIDYVDSAADLDDLGTLRVSGSGAYVRDRQRPSPDDVFVEPRVLLDQSGFTAPPEPYFAYAADDEPGSAEAAGAAGASARIPYGAGWEVTWTFDDAAGRYLRAQPWGPHIMADGTRISATNVLIIEVTSTVRKIGDGSGAPVPVLDLVDGSGSFVALAGGSAVTGTWSKAGANEHFVLHVDGGEELRLAPGKTWVELPAPGAGIAVR